MARFVTTATVISLALQFTTVGCTSAPGGEPGPGASAGAGGSSGAGGSAPTSSSCEVIAPGPSPMRRLTRFEYNNTVRDLLGDTTFPATQFPPEEIGNGFGNDAGALRVSRLLADQYVGAAKGIAERVLAINEVE